MHPVHICTSVVLLLVIASSASEEGVTIHITGPVQIITSGRDGNCFKGCPDGFVKSTGSKQCFKMFLDKPRTWEEAKKKCESEGLHLAEPSSDAVSLALRKDLIDTYGEDVNAWLGATAEGSKWMWQRRRETLSASSPLWYPHRGSNPSTGFCLVLLVDNDMYPDHPEQPYGEMLCVDYDFGYALCEV